MMISRGGNHYAAALLRRAKDRRVKILLFDRDGSKFLENTYQGTLCATVAERLAAALKSTQ
jgi:hypothetical protein